MRSQPRLPKDAIKNINRYRGKILIVRDWFARRTSSPKPIKVREGEHSLEVLDVVPDVEDEASVTTAVPDSPQSSTDHLKIEVRTVHRPGHDDGACLRCVETFLEYTVVDERLNAAISKLLHHPSARRAIAMDMGSRGI